MCVRVSMCSIYNFNLMEAAGCQPGPLWCGPLEVTLHQTSLLPLPVFLIQNPGLTPSEPGRLPSLSPQRGCSCGRLHSWPRGSVWWVEGWWGKWSEGVAHQTLTRCFSTKWPLEVSKVSVFGLISSSTSPPQAAGGAQRLEEGMGKVQGEGNPPLPPVGVT